MLSTTASVPFGGHIVRLTEAHFAATRSRANYDNALNVLDRAAKNARTPREVAAIGSMFTALQAAKSVRNAASSRAKLAATKKLAQRGDQNAAAVLNAVRLAFAHDVAHGIETKDASALKVAQALVTAADRGSAQAARVAGLVGACCDACAHKETHSPGRPVKAPLPPLPGELPGIHGNSNAPIPYVPAHGFVISPSSPPLARHPALPNAPHGVPALAYPSTPQGPSKGVPALAYPSTPGYPQAPSKGAPALSYPSAPSYPGGRHRIAFGGIASILPRPITSPMNQAPAPASPPPPLMSAVSLALRPSSSMPVLR